jgi:hypothetical protein
MLEEEAKATQEVAKATGKAIDVVQKIGGFIKEVFGDPISEFSSSLHDRIKLYRYKNFLNIIDEVTEIHSKREIDGKPIPIPPRYAIPMMEKASLEDDKSIQHMWAGLIANATDPDRRQSLDKHYIRILSSIEPIDAQTLQLLPSYEKFEKAGLLSTQEIRGLSVSQIAENLEVSVEVVKVSLLSLYDLGCIIDWKSSTWTELNFTHLGARINNDDVFFHRSLLGDSLLNACQ